MAADKFKIIITLHRAQNWESRPQEAGGIAQALSTWPKGASAPNGTVKWRGHGVGTRDGDTGNEDDSSFAGFLNLAKIRHVQFCHDMAADKFKIIITLHRDQKMEINDHIKISFSCINLYCIEKFAILAEIPCYQLMTVRQCFKMQCKMMLVY